MLPKAELRRSRKKIKNKNKKIVMIVVALFLVAPVVNLLDSWASVKEALLPVLFIVIISTVAVFAAAGWITQWLRRKGGSHD